MPSIRPFKGVVYNKDKIKNISKVVAPPYDVIPPKMQDELYKEHNNNVVRLILSKIRKADSDTDNRYTRAGKYFRSWLKNRTLIEDESAAIYIYSQKYKYENKWIERFGFISLVELDLENKGTVLPHENTLKAPKLDRLNLMRSAKANLSPIFMLYEDSRHKITRIFKDFSKTNKPFIDINIDNVRNRVWRLSERKPIDVIKKVMSKKDVFIADGHHRYETAVNYANEIENSPAPQDLKDNSKYFMAYFCELDNETLTILPTHRLIKDIGSLNPETIMQRLGKFFFIEKMSSQKKLILRLKALKSYHAFGMYLGRGGFYCIRLKKENVAMPFMGKNSKDWKSLDVAILHLFVVQNLLGIRDEDDNIEFVKGAEAAFRIVNSNKFKIAFLLNPTKAAEIKKVARHGEKMPRKATYFYPKPLSGLVINKF